MVAVWADPSDRNTVKAALKCLKVSDSSWFTPSANVNKWRNKTIEACVFPLPLIPDTMIAWGYPDSVWSLTASSATFLSSVNDKYIGYIKI